MKEKKLMASTTIIYLVYFPITILIAGGIIYLYYRVWGLENLDTSSDTLFTLFNFIVFLVLSVVFHEFLHGLGFSIANKKPFSSTKYGFQWKGFFPYAHHKEEMSVRVFRFGVILPTVVLSIIPMIVGFVVGNSTLLVAGAFNFTFGAGDYCILMKTLKLNKNQIIKDHPTEAGFTLINNKK